MHVALHSEGMHSHCHIYNNMFGTDLTIQFEEPTYSVMEGTQLSLRVQIFGRNEIPLALFFTINGSAACEDNQ